ncbi:MAG: alpha/beta fold hydrolase [Rubrobacter sp.]|nr:alpha/beta fold hydrolase [Rubrobacter sp.]
MPVMLTGETSIDYDVRGKGPPLILIGGLGFGRWSWFRQVPALSRHFRTVTFDVRGERRLREGVPDLTADVLALMDHLNIPRAHVLGSSLGGFVAQELALERPERVDRLVLIGTSAGRGSPMTMSPRALLDMAGWPGLDGERAVRRGLETATSASYRRRNPDEFEQLVRWRMADSPSAAAYYDQLRAGARFDSSRRLDRITAPALVIHGTEDRYVPPANGAALAEGIPDARLRLLDDAGHLVFIERFGAVNREITTFLKKTGKRTRCPSSRRRSRQIS